MLDFQAKISYLAEFLNMKQENYADSFKSDILMCFGHFEVPNPNFSFLAQLSSKAEIENWVNRLSSRIVLKYDEESESINDFIYDYILNG
jgi:hypothetical protein